MINTSCPCGYTKAIGDCCGPIIEGSQMAQTAEQLMRSRYTAFTLANIDYLMRSHHSSTRPTRERESILSWAKSVRWMGLTVLKTEKGQATDINGMVEFRALFIENGQMQALHERSIFKKENDKWVYVSGEHL